MSKSSRTLSCGCIICICENDEQCQGCGADTCKDFPECKTKDYMLIKRKTFDALVAALKTAIDRVQGLQGMIRELDDLKEKYDFAQTDKWIQVAYDKSKQALKDCGEGV